MATYTGKIDPEKGELVFKDDKPLNPRYDLANHSPDGFSWGYSGSGPAQLSLALLADHFGDDIKARVYYQDFKSTIIFQLDQGREWTMTTEDMHRSVRYLEARYPSLHQRYEDAKRDLPGLLQAADELFDD